MAVRWKGGWSGSGSPLTSLITYYNGDSVLYLNITYTVQTNILSIPIGSPPPPSDMSNWDVLVAGGSDGTSGSSGTSGLSGSSGTSGYGVPSGGTSGQVLAKVNGTDYNTQWVNQTGGGAGSGSDGSSGTSGSSGSSGSSGTSGSAGTSGISGSAGTSGLSGSAGTSGTSIAASYMRGSRSTAQTTGLSANSSVVFTQTDNSTGSDISLNTSTGQITLTSGKTYRLMAQIPTLTNSGAGARPSFCWFNENTSSLIGSLSAIYAPGDGSSSWATSAGMSEALITTTASTVVSYRIVGAGSLNSLGNNTDFSATGSYPWFDIQVISGNSPLVNGTSGSSGSSGTSGSSGSSGSSGTSGSSGSSGTSGYAIPEWTSVGSITFSATTTAPTKPTTRLQDNISYRRLGDKQWEVVMSWRVSSDAGAVNGTGDYLFTLPNGLSFDTTLPSQQVYTSSVASNAWAQASYIIPTGIGMINNGTVGGQVYPLIYNSTTFRILTITYGSAVQCWGAGYYGASCPGMELSFRFTST